MARLNLTIPNSLYERLERLRDRVNVSKVCAIALAKELDMLEGRTAMVDNPKVHRLIERLQTRKDRSFQRGYEEGENWMADIAEPGDIRQVLEDWELDDDETYSFDDMEWPESFDAKSARQRWLNSLREEGISDVYSRHRDSALPKEADQDAYVRGWYRAVQDIWESAAPALRWIKED